MTANYGVNVSVQTKASRRIPIQSTTTIGIAGNITSSTKKILEYFSSISSALTAYADKEGSLKESLLDIEAQVVNCPVVLSSGGTSAVAVEALKNSQEKFGVTPDILIAPDKCQDEGVPNKLETIAGYLSAVTLVDLKADTETKTTEEIRSYGNKRMLCLYGSGLKVPSRTDNNTTPVSRPLSGFMAGVMANLDAQDYGFAQSPSNRVVQGVLQGGVEYYPGQDCEADRLRTKQIISVIRSDGFRLWGDSSRSSDPIWKDIRRVRIFDRIARAIQSSLNWATDRNALDVLPYVKDSVEQFCNRLKSAKVLLGFSATWDKEQNTKTEIAAGRFYLNVDLQDMPTVKRLKITLNYSDAYGETLLELI